MLPCSDQAPCIEASNKLPLINIKIFFNILQQPPNFEQCCLSTWLDKVTALPKKWVKLHLTLAFVGVTGNLRVMVETIPIYGCGDSSKK